MVHVKLEGSPPQIVLIFPRLHRWVPGNRRAADYAVARYTNTLIHQEVQPEALAKTSLIQTRHIKKSAERRAKGYIHYWTYELSFLTPEKGIKP